MATNYDKKFLTYNQQMKKLRNDKHIECNGSPHKRILVRSGYFNLINGYKNPFVSGIDTNGNHIYMAGTSLDQIYTVKQFDEKLRSLLLRYITSVEEEVRTLTGYKFDTENDNGSVHWYDVKAYDPSEPLKNRMHAISKAYQEISQSHVDYVQFYMEHHSEIPTWIMIKNVNFSTFINVLNYSKKDVKHSICKLYGMIDQHNLPDVKLLIGSLHWMRVVRNSCAHNERIYCLSKENGRIIEKYFLQLRPSYKRERTQHIFDLFIYFKYYLPSDEFQAFISEFKTMFLTLKAKIETHAFENISGQIGIKQLSDLDDLVDRKLISHTNG